MRLAGWRRATVAAFAGHDRIVVTAAGCGSAMKGYGDLLGTDEARRFSASVRDVTEVLAELGPAPRGRRCSRPGVVYQDACHLNHAQGVADQPRAILRAIPGVELVEIEDAGMCCGSAGIYNLVQPRAARELGERKARAILAAEPDVVATANPGCAVQLAGGASPARARRPAHRASGRARRRGRLGDRHVTPARAT